MMTPQLSPVLIREVDLTVEIAENVLDNPLVQPLVPLVLVRSTSPSRFQTITVHQHFWNSLSTDSRDGWAAEIHSSYGSILKVVRVGGGFLNNANAWCWSCLYNECENRQLSTTMKKIIKLGSNFLTGARRP